MHTIWVFITDCGDSAVTAPLALLVFIFLVALRERRLGFVWILSIGGAAAVIIVLKLGFGACGTDFGGARIASPSGHTAMSTAVYGSLALLAGSRLPTGRRSAVYALAAAGIAGIAVSRLVLHEHSLPEIIIGWLVGGGAVAVFAAATGRREGPALPLGWLLLCAVILVVLLHGNRWAIEPIIRRMAGMFRHTLPYCR